MKKEVYAYLSVCFCLGVYLLWNNGCMLCYILKLGEGKKINGLFVWTDMDGCLGNNSVWIDYGTLWLTDSGLFCYNGCMLFQRLKWMTEIGLMEED